MRREAALQLSALGGSLNSTIHGKTRRPAGFASLRAGLSTQRRHAFPVEINGNEHPEVPV